MTDRMVQDDLVLGTILLVTHSFASYSVLRRFHVDTEDQAVSAYEVPAWKGGGI